MYKMISKEIILFEEDLCTGCSCCELACSYHLKRYFSPGESAITVLRSLNQASIAYHISEHCDMCSALEQPACVYFCWPGALRLGRKV